MPRRKKKVVYVWGDTPEIEALGSGFAREGYYNSGYEKARIFANMTTSSSLAARIKPDGSHAPARFAYATGVREPDLGGQFAVGTSASGLASDLKFKDARALQTAFDKSSKAHGIDPSMPGTQLAVLKGMPVFKFKEVSAVAAPPTAALADVKAAQAPAFRATREYTTGLNNLTSVLEGLERSVERATRAGATSTVSFKEFDAPVIKSSSRWV
jgi:hypothetical protein